MTNNNNHLNHHYSCIFHEMLSQFMTLKNAQFTLHTRIHTTHILSSRHFTHSNQAPTFTKYLVAIKNISIAPNMMSRRFPWTHAKIYEYTDIYTEWQFCVRIAVFSLGGTLLFIFR